LVTWPQTLVREIAQRRCVLFLGAGVSSSATAADGRRPPGWHDFLNAAMDLVAGATKRRDTRSLIHQRKYLIALQAIRSEVDPGDYQALLDRYFNRPAFTPSRLHEIILSLDSRLVITTNFDKIYERYCLSTSTEGFKVVCYDSASLADEIRSDARLIIKAHGSIDEIQRMLFTRAEYHEAKRNHANFYQILKAIFLINTVLFIGCSLEDPDVALVLEEVQITGSSQRPHYALLLRGSQTQFAIRDWQESYNIRTLTYGPTHDSLVEDLANLLSEVEALRATAA
jgi:NAD-dependent SIR2 family protein deacetylase